jgi:hypothetical protein
MKMGKNLGQNTRGIGISPCLTQSPAMRTDIWLFVSIYFGATEAAVSSNYTEGILSSGTSMIYNLFLSEYS